jgi:hypothetical protein
MRPRSWLESFLAIAALGGLAFGAGWATFTGAPADESTLLGLVFGAIAGLVGAPKFVETSVTKTFTNRTEFLKRLETRLAELELLPTTQLEDFRVYKSESAGSFSLGPVSTSGIIHRVRVKLEEDRAVLVGSRSILDQLGF